MMRLMTRLTIYTISFFTIDMRFVFFIDVCFIFINVGINCVCFQLARLEIICGHSSNVKSFPLYLGQNRVGRASDASVSIEKKSVSTLHAIIGKTNLSFCFYLLSIYIYATLTIISKESLKLDNKNK